MQVKHISRPENGPQHTVISNGSQRPGEINPQERFAVSGFQEKTSQPETEVHTCQLNRNCRSRCRAWKGSDRCLTGTGGKTETSCRSGNNNDLPAALRWFAKHHNWHELSFKTNRLKLELAFEDSVTEAVYQFIADGQGALASLIKDEFGDLMEMVKPLDLMYAERIDTRHEMMKLWEMKSQVAKSLCGLAAMLENGYRTQAKNQQPESNGTGEGSKTEWMTYKEAAGLLGIGKSALSKWAKKGRFTDNGKKGRKKRLSVRMMRFFADTQSHPWLLQTSSSINALPNIRKRPYAWKRLAR